MAPKTPDATDDQAPEGDELAAGRRASADLEELRRALSHDLKEPVRMVTAFLTLLERKAGEKLDDKAVEFLHFAMDGGARLEQMHQAMLEFVRLSLEPPAATDVELAEVFEAVEASRRRAIAEAGASVAWPEGPPRVLGDAPSLIRMVDALVDNAVRFHRAGKAAHVEVTAVIDGPRVRLSVRDNGPGVPEGQRARAVHLFTRLVTRDQVPGIGAGLTLARKIAQLHGDDLALSESPKGGLQVDVSLPLSSSSG